MSSESSSVQTLFSYKKDGIIEISLTKNAAKESTFILYINDTILVCGAAITAILVLWQSF